MRLIIILLIMSVFNSHSQNENQKIKSGVYEWKSNFKSNYPNYELNFEIKKGKNKSLGVFKGKSQISYYYMEFNSDEEKDKNRNVTGEIFGFSDGENLYLPSKFCEDCDFQDKMYFKANFIGEKYIYYDFFYPRNDIINPNTNLGTNGGDETMVVSLKNNKRFLLSKKFIKKELKKHTELYEAYKKEKRKNLVLKKYLELLDKKS
ncbi:MULTISPECIES: hypothetical protein [unclassified Winogradskyella]|uniref:hypothetical protein n=1 Tax=unclassified Winogradskyella TaxID=2615021 RepID=UPI002FF06B6F